MEHLNPPSESLWIERQKWFETKLESYEKEQASYMLGEQACALLAEAQACYCAGAWIAVIVLSYTVIDAQLLEIDFPDFKGTSKQLLDTIGAGPEYQALRLRRNRIVHFRQAEIAITVDQQWENRTELQTEAESAITLMLSAFFSSPGV